MKSFIIHSIVRSRMNRTQRAMAAEHGGLSQYILGASRRLVRGVPIEVIESEVVKHLPELKQKWRSGILEVRTPDGAVVNLETMEAATPPPPAPLPHPPLDSAANDTPSGWDMPQVAGGIPREKALEIQQEMSGGAPLPGIPGISSADSSEDPVAIPGLEPVVSDEVEERYSSSTVVSSEEAPVQEKKRKKGNR